MISKIIEAREVDGEYRFTVHLDSATVASDGSPDPAYVRRYAWQRTPPAGMSGAQYLAAIRQELKSLVQHERAQGGEGVRLSMEGEEI